MRDGNEPSVLSVRIGKDNCPDFAIFPFIRTFGIDGQRFRSQKTNMHHIALLHMPEILTGSRKLRTGQFIEQPFVGDEPVSCCQMSGKFG